MAVAANASANNYYRNNNEFVIKTHNIGIGLGTDVDPNINVVDELMINIITENYNYQYNDCYNGSVQGIHLFQEVHLNMLLLLTETQDIILHQYNFNEYHNIINSKNRINAIYLHNKNKNNTDIILIYYRNKLVGHFISQYSTYFSRENNDYISHNSISYNGVIITKDFQMAEFCYVPNYMSHPMGIRSSFIYSITKTSSNYNFYVCSYHGYYPDPKKPNRINNTTYMFNSLIKQFDSLYVQSLENNEYIKPIVVFAGDFNFDFHQNDFLNTLLSQNENFKQFYDVHNIQNPTHFKIDNNGSIINEFQDHIILSKNHNFNIKIVNCKADVIRSVNPNISLCDHTPIVLILSANTNNNKYKQKIIEHINNTSNNAEIYRRWKRLLR